MFHNNVLCHDRFSKNEMDQRQELRHQLQRHVLFLMEMLYSSQQLQYQNVLMNLKLLLLMLLMLLRLLLMHEAESKKF